MEGDLQIIRLLLEQGADPNFIAEEPTATIYAARPLELARGLWFIIDWDRYHPVVGLLEEFGATDSEERVAMSTDLSEIEQRARQWQAQKTVQKK